MTSSGRQDTMTDEVRNRALALVREIRVQSDRLEKVLREMGRERPPEKE